MIRPRLAPLFAACALLAPVCAQPAPDQKAKEFKIDKGYNGAPTTFAQMRGKALMLDFFATW